MNCPICASDSHVLTKDGVTRRRECTKCFHRFTTVERLKAEEDRLQEAVQTVREAAEKLKDAA